MSLQRLWLTFEMVFCVCFSANMSLAPSHQLWLPRYTLDQSFHQSETSWYSAFQWGLIICMMYYKEAFWKKKGRLCLFMLKLYWEDCTLLVQFSRNIYYTLNRKDGFQLVEKGSEILVCPSLHSPQQHKMAPRVLAGSERQWSRPSSCRATLPRPLAYVSPLPLLKSGSETKDHRERALLWSHTFLGPLAY